MSSKIGTVGRPGRPGSRWLAAAGVALLAWLQVAFVSEVADVRRAPARSSYHEAGVWQLGDPPVRELEEFLGSIADVVPPGSRAVFSSPGDSRQSFYRYMWAAFLWPDRDLVRPHLQARAEPEWWIAWGEPPGRDDLEPVVETPRGAVFRIR